MPKYAVIRRGRFTEGVEIEAESEEDARDKAENLPQAWVEVGDGVEVEEYEVEEVVP